MWPQSAILKLEFWFPLSKDLGGYWVGSGHNCVSSNYKVTDLIQLQTPRTTSCPPNRDQRGKPSSCPHLPGSLEKETSEANPCYLRPLTSEFSQMMG